MTRLFISYSRSDNDTRFALFLRERLRHADFFVDCFEEAERPKSWTADIERAILQTDVLVFILSSRFHEPDSQWLRREIEYAEHCQKPIIPVLIEAIAYPSQALACYRVIDFISADFHSAFRSLIEHIQALTSPRTQLLRQTLHERLRFLSTEIRPDPRAAYLIIVIRRALVRLDVPPEKHDHYLAEHMEISERLAQSLIKGTFPVDELSDDFLMDLADTLEMNADDLRAIVDDTAYFPEDRGAASALIDPQS